MAIPNVLLLGLDTTTVDELRRQFSTEDVAFLPMRSDTEVRDAVLRHRGDVVVAALPAEGPVDAALTFVGDLAPSGCDCVVLIQAADQAQVLRQEQAAFQAGIFEVISPPATVPRIATVLRRCLDRRRLERDNQDLQDRLRQAKVEFEKAAAGRVAEVREAYAKVVEAQTQLARLEGLKSQFIRIVTHEFNTPINVIKGYLHLLYSNVFGPLSGPQIQALNTVERESDRLGDLLNDFVKIYQLEDGAFGFKREDVVVKPLVQTTISKLVPFFVYRSQQYILNLPDDLPKIVANPRQVSIVIENLVLNAIRFTPDSGLITISCQPFMHFGRFGVLFLVRDTGIGIEPDKQKQIFERFYEASDIDRHRSGRVEFGSSGLGLGLAIARKIVEGHEGEIWVESVPGQGSKFYFFIPASQSDKKMGRLPTDTTLEFRVPPELRKPFAQE